MKSLRLGIDLDGVVADFNAGWTARYNAEFGASIGVADVIRWDGPLDLTHFEHMDEFWTWAQETPTSFFRELPTFPGAEETIASLARAHRIVIVTSKFDWAVPDTLAWLAELRMPVHEVHFTWDKPGVPCDVYLEDAPHNLERLVVERPAATVCRFVRPWNDPIDGAIDVTDWDEFAAVVDDVARGAADADRGTSSSSGPVEG